MLIMLTEIAWDTSRIVFLAVCSCACFMYVSDLYHQQYKCWWCVCVSKCVFVCVSS